MMPRWARSVGLAAALWWAAPSIVAMAEVPFTRVVIDPVPPNGPDTKTVGDIDGDGFPDIVVASSTGGGMVWYRSPAWTRHVIRDSGGWTTDMQVADVDGDGDLDLVVPNGSGIMWYRNPRPAGNPATDPWAEFLIGADGANHHDVEVGDLNGDGRIDVVTRQHGGGTYVWIQNTPTVWTQLVPSTDYGEGTALGDIDGDGDVDIAHNGFWLENPLPAGDPFAPWPRHTIDAAWFSVYVGVLVVDVNGDGRNDVVVAPSESADGRFSWYEAADPRNGPWVEHLIDASVSYFHTFKAADMDGDGDLDLVTAEMHQSSDPDEVSVYLNQGGGGVAWTQQVVATTGSHNLRIADIDADGDVDIVGVNWHESAADGAAVTLWRNLRASSGPAIELAVADATLQAGDSLLVAAAVENPGPAVVVDVLFGAALPAGSPDCPGLSLALFVDRFRAVETSCLTGGAGRLPALLASVPLPPQMPRLLVSDFLTTIVPPGLPAGDYLLFLVLAAPGSLDDGRIDAGDIVALTTAQLTLE